MLAHLLLLSQPLRRGGEEGRPSNDRALPDEKKRIAALEVKKNSIAIVEPCLLGKMIRTEGLG